MPFTFCHPAIVLPFNKFSKRWFSFSGLIIGSMSPDFEYFLRMRISSSLGHSISGIFLFDLPISIFCAYLFFNIVAKDLISNLPIILKSRLHFITQIKWNNYFNKNWIVVVYSIIIGAITHIMWDSFTHKEGFFVLRCDLLSDYFYIFSRKLYVYKILQHGSTLIAGMYIVFFISKLESVKSTTINTMYKKYWLMIFAISFLIVLIRISIGGFGSIGTFIVTCIAAGLYSLVITSLLSRRQSPLNK